MKLCQLARMRTLSDEAGDQLVLVNRLRDTALQVSFEKHGDKIEVNVIERKEAGALVQLSLPQANHMLERHRRGGPCTPPSISVFRTISIFDPDLVVEAMHTE